MIPLEPAKSRVAMTSNPKRFRYVELGLVIALVAVLAVVSTGSTAPGQAAPLSVATHAAARADASVESANTIVGRAEFQVGYDSRGTHLCLLQPDKNRLLFLPPSAY